MLVHARWLVVPVFTMALTSCVGADTVDSQSRNSVAAPAPARSSARPTETIETLPAALKRIDVALDIPVVLPSGLPNGFRPARNPVYITDLADGTTVAQLHLRFPHGQLIVEYGNAGFDGCGPLHPRHVRVGDHPALLERIEDGFYEVIWPARTAIDHGRYGLSGLHVTREQIMRWARSMDVRVRAAKRAGPTATSSPQIGC